MSKRLSLTRYISDLYSGPGSWNEGLVPKYKVRDYLNKKAEEGKITWTNVACGLFYDWSRYSYRLANTTLTSIFSV